LKKSLTKGKARKKRNRKKREREKRKTEEEIFGRKEVIDNFLNNSNQKRDCKLQSLF